MVAVVASPALHALFTRPWLALTPSGLLLCVAFCTPALGFWLAMQYPVFPVQVWRNWGSPTRIRILALMFALMFASMFAFALYVWRLGWLCLLSGPGFAHTMPVLFPAGRAGCGGPFAVLSWQQDYCAPSSRCMFGW